MKCCGVECGSDFSKLVLRLALGGVMFPHGAQKALGWFGGPGYNATIGMFTHMGIPAFLAVLVIAAEFLGSLGLIFGVLTRLSAFGIGVEMATAVFLIHRHYGFFMNWMGKKTGEGYEYHMLVIGIALALLISGGGKWTIEHIFCKACCKSEPKAT